MSNPRQALLDTIIDEIAASGLSETSMRELAQAVGTSHRMLNHHFGGRAGLVAAMVAETESGSGTCCRPWPRGWRGRPMWSGPSGRF